MDNFKEYPSYNALDRTAMFMGVPLLPAVMLLMVALLIFLVGGNTFGVAGFMFGFVVFPIFLFLRQISQTDDRALYVLYLEMIFKLKRIGDTVILNNLGRQPVNIPDPQDETKTKTVTKNLWEMEKYEPVLDLPNVIEHDSEREQQQAVATDKTKENEEDVPNQPKKTPNLSDFEFELPSNIKNNYIAIVKNRHLSDQKINYYDKDDKDQVNIAFEDRNKSLHTSRQDEKTIYAMLDMAQSKGWSDIKLKGTEEFKQKAWLEASLRGIGVKGYEPNEKDLAELQAKQQARTTNQVEMTAQKPLETNQQAKVGENQPQQTPPTQTGQETIYNKLQDPKDNQAYLDRIGKDFKGANISRLAKNNSEAKELAKNFTGTELTNFHSGIQAVISNKNLDKMLSGKASNKSVNEEIHAIAVANADKLFENSVFAWQSGYKNDSPDIEAVHRTIAPMKVDDQVYLAKLTVKEMTREQGNRVYSIEAVEVEQEKSPIPEMTETDNVRYTSIPHRLNGALIDIIVKNAQEYNKNSQEKSQDLQNNNKDTSEQTNQPTALDIKKDIRQIFQTGYKNGSIKSRDELVAVLKERGFEVKENDKSIRVSLPNSDQAVNLKGEVFTKGYDAIKSLKERLEPETLKQTYPTLTDGDIVHVTAYKNKLFDSNRDMQTPKVLQASLVRLEDSIKDMAKGKDVNLPDLPVNEIKPDIEVRTTDNHDKSRQV